MGLIFQSLVAKLPAKWSSRIRRNSSAGWSIIARRGQNARLRAVLRCIQALLKRIPNVVCARKKHLVSNLDLDG